MFQTKEAHWAIRLDGQPHAVRATAEQRLSDFQISVYVDNVLISQNTVWVLVNRELARFQRDGHEYVLRFKGWGSFGALELRVDGLEAEVGIAGPLAAPPSEIKTDAWSARRVELVETQRIEEPLGEDRRVIDNSRSSAEVRRTMTMSREWSQTIAIDDETTTSVKGEVGGKVWALVDLKLEAERKIRAKYSTSTETTRKFSDEVVITVPAKTKIELTFAWKQVWQCGLIRVHAADGSTMELSYRLCLEPTFDQRQVQTA